jgi:uncharacterized protein
MTLKTSVLMALPPGAVDRRRASTGRANPGSIQGRARRLTYGLWEREGALLLAFLTLVACSRGPHVVVHAARGPVAVSVEIASTPATRERGLMYRNHLGADAGMLFLFPRDDDLQFWMKNTPLPLDMIFIDASHIIVGIVADTRPFRTQARGVGKPSRYVLEVHAGFCASHGIAAGDRVEFTAVPDTAS